MVGVAVVAVGLVAVAVVAVALVGVDLVGARIARRRVAGVIAGAWGTASAPEVLISGPFLVQLMVGRFREVRLRVAAFTSGGIGFGGLDATLTSVRAPVRELLAGRGVVAGQLAATVAIPFGALAERLPPGFTLRRHEQELRIHGWALAVPVTGTVAVSADLRRISVNPRIAGIPSLVGFRIELPGLPPDVVITSISLADTALTISLTGRDVALAAAGSVERGAVDQVRRPRAR